MVQSGGYTTDFEEKPLLPAIFNEPGNGLEILSMSVAMWRFAVPLALIANEVVYDLFLESMYLASTPELEATGQVLECEETGPVTGSTQAKEDETRSIIGQPIDRAGKTLDLRQKDAAIKQKTSQLIEHLIQLSMVFIL